jgi:hypothetical protein
MVNSHVRAPNTVEARVKYLRRHMERSVGDHLVFSATLGSRKHTKATVVWMQPWGRGGVELWGASIDRRLKAAGCPLGIYITHHALSRLYERLGTTDIAAVAKAIRLGVGALLDALYAGHPRPHEFAVPAAGGHLLFVRNRIELEWTAKTYLGAGMRHNLPVIGQQPAKRN